MLLLSLIPLILANAPLQQPGPEPGGSRFGRAVLALDDLDGDGVREIAVGAPTASGGRGLVLVLSGKTQDVLATWKGPEARSTFGHTLRSIPDVNGDGVDDVLIGFEFGARTELRSGKDGELVHAIDRGWEEVIPLGDYDGDGAGDLLLTTAPLWEVRSGRTNALLNGRTLVQSHGRFDPIGDVNGDGLVDGIYFSKTASPMLSTRPNAQELATAKPFDLTDRSTLRDLWPGTLTGVEGDRPTLLHAAPAGDLDGDGHRDFLITVANKKSNSIIALSFEKRSSPLTRIDRPASRFGEGPPIGHALLGGIDLDGNRRDDLVFGNTSLLGFQAVAAPGATEKPTRQAKWPAFDGAHWCPDWSDDGPSSGVSLAAFDDADGDGIRDVLLGSSDWFSHGSVARSGALRLLSGRTGKEIWTVTEHRYGELGAAAVDRK